MSNQSISINNIQNKIILPGQLQNVNLIQQNINNNSNQSINQNKNSNFKNPLNNIQIPPPTNNQNISQNNGILSPHKTMINMIPQQTLSLIDKDNISFNDKNNQVDTNIKVPFNNPIPFLQNIYINYIGKSNSNPNFLSKQNQYYQQNPIFIKQQNDDISQNKKINIVQPIENNYINYQQNNTNISHNNQNFNINKHEINVNPSQNMIITNNNMNLNINKQYQGNNNIPSYFIKPNPNTNMLPQSSTTIPHQEDLKMTNVEMPQQNINYSITLQSQNINKARRQNINLQNFSQNYNTLQQIPNSSKPIQNVIQQSQKNINQNFQNNFQKNNINSIQSPNINISRNPNLHIIQNQNNNSSDISTTINPQIIKEQQNMNILQEKNKIQNILNYNGVIQNNIGKENGMNINENIIYLNNNQQTNNNNNVNQQFPYLNQISNNNISSIYLNNNIKVENNGANPIYLNQIKENQESIISNLNINNEIKNSEINNNQINSQNIPNIDNITQNNQSINNKNINNSEQNKNTNNNSKIPNKKILKNGKKLSKKGKITKMKLKNEHKPTKQYKVERKRPVYAVPPSKKRSVSQGKPFNLIHKYYDENYILEDDEEEASKNEEKLNKKSDDEEKKD